MRLKLRNLIRITLVMCSLTISNQLFSQTTIASYNFNNNSQGWIDGGSFANYTNSSSYYCNNSGAIFIRYSHDFNTTSKFTSPALNLVPYSTVEFSFCMTSINIDNGEGFDLEYSNDNGSTWTTVKDYRRGSDFTNNNAAPNGISFTVSLSGCDYTFNANSRFRFIGKSNSTNEYFVFDDVLIQGFTGSEINLIGNTNSIINGDNTPDVIDNTNYGKVDVAANDTRIFTIENNSPSNLTLTGTPLVSISGSAEFTVTTQPSVSIIAGCSSDTFVVTYAPVNVGIDTAIISISNNDSNENPYTFTVQGEGSPPLTEGPGGVTSDLKIWLKSTTGLSYTDGDAVALWADQGRAVDATALLPGQEPTYKNSVNDNINFNPVIDFSNDSSASTVDTDLNAPDQQFLYGTSGYYTQDMFVVSLPDQNVTSSSPPVDMFCGDNPTDDTFDITGIGYGNYVSVLTDEVIAFGIGQDPNGYFKGYSTATSIFEPSIINARNNSSSGPTSQELYLNARNVGNDEVNLAQFKNLNNEEFLLGRSEWWSGSYTGRIAEVITFSSRKNDVNLTQERNRIASYLAIKYGITLGTNGTSQDYVDSSGSLIWDSNTGVAVNDVFNSDIAGIGRDDDSGLLQKQSRSSNAALDGGFRVQGVLTMGISQLYDTNAANTSTDLNDGEFIVWGNNGINLDNTTPYTVNLSSSISPTLNTDVSFTAMQRTWKVIETGGDVPEVEVQILKSAVRIATPTTGDYLMFVSDSPVFDSTTDYEVVTETTNELGEDVLSINYDFDGTKYITFGWAPELSFERSIYFNGINSYIETGDNLNLNPSEFTLSAWIKHDAGAASNGSIISKRASGFTNGFDLRIRTDDKIQMLWKNGSNQEILSNTRIPDDQWHQVTATYDGTNLSLYIDGVLDVSLAKSAPINNNESFIIGAGGKTGTNLFFQGNIDEVRVWSTALTQEQLRYIMNQEIEDNSNFVGGSYFISRGITPTLNEGDSMDWNTLEGYYPMSTYTYTNTKDESGKGNSGILRNLRTVDRQTAPLPYRSTQNGNWDTSTTWQNGDVQTIPGTTSIVDNTISIDWNIVQTSHDVVIDDASDLPSGNNDNRTISGLFVDSATLTLAGDTASNTGTGLTVSHYLNLDGDIDLNGESQLIQSLDSDLEISSSGKLDRDQQGTRDLFTYNYWSSPVGTASTTNNNTSYTLPDVLMNGTNPSSPNTINFLTSGYDGNITGATIGIADYWIWKFNNLPHDDYSSWQHVRSTGNLEAGEGYTMKGVTDTSGNIGLEQNYVFSGKPNNGAIELDIDNNNDYLLGNPYPSAIDSHTFINDNGPVIQGEIPTFTGTLYFWEHWGGGSHILHEYQGGYATYNLSGGTGAAFVASLDDDVDQGGAPNGTKIPGRYIPVSQGFFVVGSQDNSKINFNNGQRVFIKEATGASVFMEANDESIDFGDNQEETQDADPITNEDSRRKIRLGFDSVNTYHRQLLVTEDSNASMGIDWGYDGQLNEDQLDDMFWIIEDASFVIQGTNEFNEHTILPIGIKNNDDGITTILIDALENFDNTIDIYLHDKELEIYHDLKDSKYNIYLNAGDYLDRFEITFSTGDLLNVVANTLEVFEVNYTNSIESIVINNPTLKEIASVKLLNMLGQEIYANNTIAPSSTTTLKVRNLSTGAYIINIKTRDNKTISKKVLVK